MVRDKILETAMLRTPGEDKTSDMAIRNATYKDLVPAAHLLARAFFDDDLFGELMHPGRHQHPDDVHYWWLYDLRETYVQPSTGRIRLMCEEDRIIGVAVWQSRSAKRDKNDAEQACVKTVHEFSRLEDGLWPNRALDPAQSNILVRAKPFHQHLWTGERAESEYLGFLAVDKAYRGRGHGRTLVLEGFDVAKRRGTGTSVIASHDLLGFYKGCGFDKIAGYTGEGEGNPLRDLMPQTIMFWDGELSR